MYLGTNPSIQATFPHALRLVLLYYLMPKKYPILQCTQKVFNPQSCARPMYVVASWRDLGVVHHVHKIKTRLICMPICNLMHRIRAKSDGKQAMPQVDWIYGSTPQVGQHQTQ